MANRYAYKANHLSLPTHCERIACYWATLVCFDKYASGKAVGQRYKAVRAFKQGLRNSGMTEENISFAYKDTVELARLKMNAD